MHGELLKLSGWEGLYKWVMKASVDVTPFLFDKHFWLLFQISCSLGQCFPLTVIISIVWNCLCGSLISWHLFFSYLVELGFLSACRCTHRSWHQWPGRNGSRLGQQVTVCPVQTPSEALADSWQRMCKLLCYFFLQKLCFCTATFLVCFLWLLCSGLFLFSKFINEQNSDLYTLDT